MKKKKHNTIVWYGSQSTHLKQYYKWKTIKGLNRDAKVSNITYTGNMQTPVDSDKLCMYNIIFGVSI